jgi:phospholipase/carboxylesterase
MQRLRTSLGGLDVVILDPGQPEHPADLNVVLCHGFGAPGDDLVALGPELTRLAPSIATRVRWVFPQGPLSLAPMGYEGGRAWWSLDLERMFVERNWDVYSEEVPPGLAQVRRQLTAMLEELTRVTRVPMGRTVLGGFSQGAMLTTDLTLRLEEPPLGLSILSGSLISRPDWSERAPRRAGLPVFQSHGRQDPILPFDVAERLHRLLSDAGLKAEFVPFNGPHAIPMAALTALAKWLESLSAGLELRG